VPPGRLWCVNQHGPQKFGAAADPAFWNEYYPEDVRRPRGWEDANGAQRCVLYHADEQATLGEMLADFLGKAVDGVVMVEVEQRREEDRTSAIYALQRGREWQPCSDAAALRAGIPLLANVVMDLAVNGVVEVHQAPSADADIDDATELASESLGEVLAEPSSWLFEHGSGSVVVLALADRVKRKGMSGP
jgi:hypothetical protein